MHFGITEKPTTDCVSLYNNAGHIFKLSEAVARENAENCRCRQLHCRLTPPPQGTSMNIRINLILPEIRITDLHYAADNMGLSSFKFFMVGSESSIFSAIECISAVQGPPRPLIWHQWKGVCDFLLVINSKFGPIFILHRFWDTATYWLLWVFPTPLSFSCTPSLGWTLSNFWINFLSPRLESLGYPLVKFSSLRDPSLRRFDSVPACDRQTDRESERDRETDIPTVANTGLCIASYADAL